MKIAIAVSIFCLLCVHGSSEDETTEGVTKVNIDFVWDFKDLKRSPEVHLDNVPDGAESLRTLFFDDTASDYEHGGGILPYDGSGTIHAGTL